MLDFFRRQRQPAEPAPITRDDGARAARNVQELLTDGACLMGNLAGAAQDVSIRVANGDRPAAELHAALDVLRAAHADMERACLQVSRARELLSYAADDSAVSGES